MMDPAHRPDRRSRPRDDAFYAYVGQLVPQKEVQPPQETVLRADLTTADMVKVGREIMEGKGLCLTCHTIGKTGALRFPDLAGVDARAKTRVAGPERCRVSAEVPHIIRTRRSSRPRARRDSRRCRPDGASEGSSASLRRPSWPAT